MKKIIIFSHESDIDGLGSIVLSKIAFKDFDYVLLPGVEKLKETFIEYIKTNKLNNYDMIYITDLSLYEPALSMVAESSLKDKVLVFDHHQGAIEANLNRYSFTKVIEEDEKGKRCGTDLFYEHLLQNNLISRTKALDTFVEYTRLEDSWDWKKYQNLGQLAHDLSILFNVIGKENYILRMLEKLLRNPEKFEYDEEELKLIQEKKDEYNNILKNLTAEIEYFVDEKNNKYGIAYVNYEYRNELPEYIRENSNPENIKYMIIVAMDKGENGQKSYRSIDKSFDVNEMAMLHGGGGHPTAAAVNISKEQKEQAKKLPKREGLKYLADSKYFK